MLDKHMKVSTKGFVYIVLTLFALVLCLPFVYMLSISLASPESNAKDMFTIIPHEFYWKNFTDLFADAFGGARPVGKWFLNTMFIVVMSICGQMFACSMVAFGFARMQYRQKNKIFMLLLATMMLPGQITLIPVFVMFTKLGLYDTFWPLIIPQFFGSAYNIFFTRQFVTAVPGQLYEAAEIDGLSYFGIYRKIVLPLVKPALCAIAIFTFNWAWGDVMGPLIYLQDSKKFTLALGVANMSASVNPTGALNMSVVMGLSLMMSIPQILIYFIGQKYLFQLNLGIGNSGSK